MSREKMDMGQILSWFSHHHNINIILLNAHCVHPSIHSMSWIMIKLESVLGGKNEIKR